MHQVLYFRYSHKINWHDGFVYLFYHDVGENYVFFLLRTEGSDSVDVPVNLKMWLIHISCQVHD